MILPLSSRKIAPQDPLFLSVENDIGSGFKNYTLDEFLTDDEGIKLQYFAAYTTQQNGVAKPGQRAGLFAARHAARGNSPALARPVACRARAGP